MSNAALAAPSKQASTSPRLDGDADLVATVDGDGQMDPRRLDRFLDPLVDGDADYAKGPGSAVRTHGRMPAFRLFGNRLLTLLCDSPPGTGR